MQTALLVNLLPTNFVVTAFLVVFIAAILHYRKRQIPKKIQLVIQNGGKERNNNVGKKLTTRNGMTTVELTRFDNIPGPWSPPIVGCSFCLGKKPEVVLATWAEKYGPVFKMKIGSMDVVVVTGYELIKEALYKQGKAFGGRPPFLSSSYVSGGLSLSFGSNTPSWKVQKREAVKALKMYTGGKDMNKTSILEKTTLDQANIFVKELLSQEVNSDIKTSTISAAANVILMLCFGLNFQRNDPTLKEMLKKSESFQKIMGAMNVINFCPWMAKLPVISRPVKNFKTYMEEFNTFISTLVGKTWSTYDEHKLRHIADCLRYQSDHENFDKDDVESGNELSDTEAETLHSITTNDLTEKLNHTKFNYPTEYTNNEQKYIGEANGVTFEPFTFEAKSEKEAIFRTIGDLYGAGFDTTSTAFSWMVLYLTVHQDVQEKIALEVEREIPSDEEPSFRKHGDRCLYLRGFINEVLRHCPMFPLPLPHYTTSDAYLNGYHIPKGVTVFCNFWEVQMNKEIWGDPEHFRPERFILEDSHNKERRINKDLVQKSLAFSIGYRRCPGEKVARNELFIFIAVLLRKVKIKPFIEGVNPKLPWPVTEGLALAPEPFKVKVYQRNFFE